MLKLWSSIVKMHSYWGPYWKVRHEYGKRKFLDCQCFKSREEAESILPELEKDMLEFLKTEATCSE